MEQYIPKAAVVAEIENRLAEINDVCQGYIANKKMVAEYILLNELRDFLDTLEVKEDYIDNDFGSYWGEYVDSGGDMNNYEVAKQFFELGNKAQKVE